MIRITSLYCSALSVTPLLLFFPALVGARPGTAISPPAPVNQASAAEDILDIYGPIPIPEPTPYLAYGAALLLGLLLISAGWLLWRRWSRRKKEMVQDPALIALSSLMEAERGLQEQGIVVFANKVSHILRAYIEARFNLPSTTSTTREFFSQLDLLQGTQNKLLCTEHPVLKQCLELCDRIKFSRFQPEHETVGELSKHSRQFIETTRLQPSRED